VRRIRVALLGATGQLGHDIARVAERKDIELLPLGHEQVEITNLENVQEALAKFKPSTVINSAAFHQVDRCEENPAEALRVNGLGAFNVARATNALEATCVYVSTDYVFSGEKPPPKEGQIDAHNSYTENDRPGPVNVYGASKLAGEHLTRVAQPNALIVRVASLFGVAGARGKGGNFIEAILKKAKTDEQLQVVNDQFMTPTYTMDAADAILRLAETKTSGVVHVTNSGACTWYTFASKAIELTSIRASVKPIQSSLYPSKAKRPPNSALNNSLSTTFIGGPLRRWEDALQEYLNEKGHTRR